MEVPDDFMACIFALRHDLDRQPSIGQSFLDYKQIRGALDAALSLLPEGIWPTKQS